MKKALLILLIIMAPIAMVSQNQKRETFKSIVETNKSQTITIDSLKNKINLLDAQFANISREITTVKDLNDYTEKELISLRSKEDFYGTTLNIQTGLYIFIVILLIGFGSYFTLKKIKKEIKKAENNAQSRIELQQLEFDEKLEKIDAIEKESYLTIGHSNLSIAVLHSDKEKNIEAISFYLKGIKHLLLWNYTHNEKETKPQFDTEITNFNNIKNLIDFISDNPTEIKKYKNEYSKLLNELDEIDPSNYKILKDKIAEIRVGLNQLNDNGIVKEKNVSEKSPEKRKRKKSKEKEKEKEIY